MECLHLQTLLKLSYFKKPKFYLVIILYLITSSFFILKYLFYVCMQVRNSNKDVLNDTSSISKDLIHLHRVYTQATSFGLESPPITNLNVITNAGLLALQSFTQSFDKKAHEAILANQLERMSFLVLWRVNGEWCKTSRGWSLQTVVSSPEKKLFSLQQNGAVNSNQVATCSIREKQPAHSSSIAISPTSGTFLMFVQISFSLYILAFWILLLYWTRLLDPFNQLHKAQISIFRFSILYWVPFLVYTQTMKLGSYGYFILLE